MIELDKYFGTNDEHFNKNIQGWYFQFTPEPPIKTKKKFIVYAEALHDVYFFIFDNLNKPMSCIEKIKEAMKKAKFNKAEKLLFVDALFGVLLTYSYYKESKNITKIFIQILDFRHTEIKPYDGGGIQEYKESLKFDFEKIKEDFSKLNNAIERHDFIFNIAIEYDKLKNEIDYIEENHYTTIGFFSWLEAEMKRAQYEINKAIATQGIKQQQQKKNDTTGHKHIAIAYRYAVETEEFDFKGKIQEGYKTMLKHLPKSGKWAYTRLAKVFNDERRTSIEKLSKHLNKEDKNLVLKILEEEGFLLAYDKFKREVIEYKDNKKTSFK
jgi:hypothetical protein